MTAYCLEDLELCDLGTHKINLIDESPIWEPTYRFSEKETGLIDQEVNNLMKAGHVVPSRSKFRSIVFLVSKKDGGHRMVVNYKKLNSKTVSEPWPLPRIDDILS